MADQRELPSLDKTKYLEIAKNESLSAAITALHHELWELENECFEGREGWNPELYELLKEYRDFSMELWDKRFG